MTTSFLCLCVLSVHTLQHSEDLIQYATQLIVHALVISKLLLQCNVNRPVCMCNETVADRFRMRRHILVFDQPKRTHVTLLLLTLH